MKHKPLKVSKKQVSFLEFDNPEDLRIEEERLIVSFLVQKTKNTQRAYKKEISDFLEFLQTKHIYSLRACRTTHCAEFLTTKSHLSSASLKRSKDSLSSLMTFLQKASFLSANPFLALDSTQVEDLRGHRSLSKEVIKRLLALDGTLRDISLVRFIYVTGLRRDEVTRVKFSHFKVESDTAFLTVFGKGRKIRTVALSREFYNSYIEPLNPGKSIAKDPFVFRSTRNWQKPLSTDRIYEIVKTRLVKAGAPKEASPHWLRHSHGTHAADAGINLRVLQKSLGHSSLATTQIYLDSSIKESSALVIEESLK